MIDRFANAVLDYVFITHFAAFVLAVVVVVVIGFWLSLRAELESNDSK